MNKLLITLILLGITVILAPAIFIGLGVAWSIIWPILVIAALVYYVAILVNERKRKEAFVTSADTNGLTSTQTKDLMRYNSLVRELDQITAEQYKAAIDHNNKYTLSKVEDRIEQSKTTSAKVALFVSIGFALMVFFGYISVHHN